MVGFRIVLECAKTIGVELMYLTYEKEMNWKRWAESYGLNISPKFHVLETSLSKSMIFGGGSFGR